MYDRFETHHIFPNSYPEGGVAPSRHSLAKFEYLQKQRRRHSMHSERAMQEVEKNKTALIKKVAACFKTFFGLSRHFSQEMSGALKFEPDDLGR